MKKQNPNPVLEDEYMSNIFKSKNLSARALLLAASMEVDERCNKYVKALPTLESVAKKKWDAALHDALILCYESNTKALSILKDAIIDALRKSDPTDLQRCPFCMLDEPSTWDHYLPKAHYPEYSVFYPNLVYICFRCNHKKDDFCEDSKLLFCHPYYTVHPVDPILHCKISADGSDLKIEYYVAGYEEINSYVQIASQHMERLKLARRFNSESAAVVSTLIAELRQQYPKGIDAECLKSILHIRYKSVDVSFGPNAWEARLWHGLANCADFLNYLNIQILSIKHPTREGFELVAPLMPVIS